MNKITPAVSNNHLSQEVIDPEDSLHRRDRQYRIVGAEESAKDIMDIELGDEQQEKEEVLVLKNIHKTYLLGVEGVSALRGIDLKVQAGEFLIIYGASGGGKTSLLNVMGTIDKPTKGDLVICGHKIKSTTDDNVLASLRLSYLGFVFQTFNLIPSLTALENVKLPMVLQKRLSSKEVEQRAESLLERVGLQARKGHFPNQLSGGEQQRVTIARALANQPQVLFLDEPTGDLDTKSSDTIMKMLLDLNLKDGITMVMVTHDKALRPLASKVIRLVDGRIQNTEPIAEQERRAAIRELHQQGEGEGVLGVKVGADTAESEVRERDAYAALRFQMKR